jgi:3-phosphoshikimate 1-carboxyvinyltransferase
MIEIKPAEMISGEVEVPGSKSYSHRIIIAAALSDGVCNLSHTLKSEDILLTREGLSQMGVVIEEKNDTVTVRGAKGNIAPSTAPIYLGNSGTSMRLLTGVAAMGKGEYVLTGTKRMAERPIGDLLDALTLLGVFARSENGNGCPPVRVKGGPLKGGKTRLRCNISSQYLSSLLLIAPYTENGLEITITGGPVSKPYIDMTVDIMERMGVEVSRWGYEQFYIPGNQCYKAGPYVVEPDCSQAGYFWAAAAVTGGCVKVKRIIRETRQGDVRFAEVLERMGCNVKYEPDGITVTGKELFAVETDMSDMPDIVPTLGVVAAFAKGTTVIKNVAHLKAKESDRLNATATELNKMGITATALDDGLIIYGGTPHGAQIHTYDDHRMAMSLSLAALGEAAITINDPGCVSKTFPDFFEVLASIVQE